MSFLKTARFYTPAAFDNYMSKVFGFGAWRPSFVVLHNTSSPTIAQRPHGFTSQHMVNLRDFYEKPKPDGQGWSGGPHLFIDQNGIWLFCDLDEPGVHSPSWNSVSWGVEMLGEFENEVSATGPGAAIVHNAVCAIAAMHKAASLDSHTLKLHRWDPKTTHKECPGSNIDYNAVQQRVHDRIAVLNGGKGRELL